MARAAIPIHDDQVAKNAQAAQASVEQVTEKMGVNVEAFVATVNRYNELVAKGDDEDFLSISPLRTFSPHIPTNSCISPFIKPQVSAKSKKSKKEQKLQK